MQKSIYDHSSTLDKIPKDEIARYLETHNYTVRHVQCTRAFSLDGVIDYFYEKLREKKGDIYKYACNISKNHKKDRKALSEFQKQVLRDNYSKKAASMFMLNFIDDFFKYYDRIGLYEDIRSLSFLFSEKGGWIYFKIQDLKKRDIKAAEQSEDAEQLFDIMCNTEDNDTKEFLANKQKELLRTYGKKKG